MNKLSFSLIFLFTFFLPLFTQQDKLPSAYVELNIGKSIYKNGDKIRMRTGEKVDLLSKMNGGRRIWCMFPAKYANMGKNTKIESSGENGLSFSTGPEFRGVWSLKSEIAAWWGQLNDQIKAVQSQNTAILTAPNKPGTYVLTVKLTTIWHYIRMAQGMKTEKDEEEKGEATFSVIVEQGGNWFSSANITASGDEDNDLKFRLQTLQSRYEAISDQVLKNQYPLAKSGLEGIREELNIIKRRIEQLQKEKKFNCEITLIGLPTDKGMKRYKTLLDLKAKYKTISITCGSNAQQINSMLLNKQMNFTNNILKSVFKNYLDWGSGLPNVNNFFGAVPYNLSALVMPSDLMGWWEESNKDASILKNQAQSVAKLDKLRDFYLKRQKETIIEEKNILSEMEKNKATEQLDKDAKSIISGFGIVKFKASNL
jgi:hypothetical protein